MGHRQLDKTSTNMIRRGRKSNKNKQKAFLEACEWLENETQLHTLNTFRDKIRDLQGTDKVLKSSYVRTLLMKLHGHHVSFSEEKGKATTIYLVDMAKYIIENSTKKRNTNSVQQI